MTKNIFIYTMSILIFYNEVDIMGELKREWEVIKKECTQDPGARASWIGIAIMLGICVLIGLFVLVTLVL